MTAVHPNPAKLDAEPVIEASSMLRDFGLLFHYFVEPFVARLRLEDHAADQVREAAAQGPVVYVLLETSTFDYLALNYALRTRDLPLATWANHVDTRWWRPLSDAWRALRRKGKSGDAMQSGRLQQLLRASGQSIAIFLQKPGSAFGLAGDTTTLEPLESVIAVQHHAELPIQMIPTMVVWNRAPDFHRSTVEGFLAGTVEWPRTLMALRSAITGQQQAFVQFGAPVDLREFFERVDPPQRPKALHTLLRRFLHRESNVIRGPRLLPHRVMKRIVLDNPPMRELAQKEAELSGKSLSRVLRKMDRDFDGMAANFRWWIVQSFSFILQPLWTRIYSGVDIRPEDLARIRNAMRQGTAVMVPSHKSHFDYLLLSWVFYQHDIVVPHVVAGINLAIWPVSILLRGSGAFFIKRSFSGDRIFPAVFARYVRELIRQNYPVEFFIEGGRTRSGKLMAPKLGVLGMVIEASEWRRAGHSVTLLPIAFAYEQVAEEQTYARELSGEEKKAESVGQLVKARSILGRRYGRVYMRVGEPIVADHLVDAQDGRPPWHELPRAEQKQSLQYMGEKLIHRIGRVTLALPTALVAMALIAHHRRGLRHSELLDRVARFRELLRSLGALEAESMKHASQATHEAIGRFLGQKLIEGLDHHGERVWSIVIEKRITLDFHKNQVLHFLASIGFATAAIRARAPGPFQEGDLTDEFEFIARTLCREFILDPDVPLSEHLAQGVTSLIRYGALLREDDTLRIADADRLGELHGLFRSTLESYAAVLDVAPLFVEKGVKDKDLPKLIQHQMPTWVTRPEANSLVSLQNAIGTFVDQGLLMREPDGRFSLNDALRQQWLDRLKRMAG